MNKIVALPIATAIATTLAPSLAAASEEKALPAPVHATAAHPDAELFDLVDQFIAADRRYRESWEIVDRMDKAFRHQGRNKPLPDVLRWRRSDKKLGLPALHTTEHDPKPNFNCENQVSRIRGKKWLVGITNRFEPKQKQVLHWKAPSKAARKRADEIIAAYQEWSKEGTPPRGYKKAVREKDRADNVAFALEKRVLDTRATTVDGMLAKIRCVHAQATWQWAELPPVEKLEKLDLDEISGSGSDMARSIFRDLQRIALGGGLSSAIPMAGTNTSIMTADPIFAAIERHRSADSRCQQIWKEQDSEEACEKPTRERFAPSNHFMETVWRPARDNLVSTSPETPHGLAALMTYLREKGGIVEAIGDDRDPMLTLERSIERAARKWAARQATA
jgi:hypothetical protein